MLIILYNVSRGVYIFTSASKAGIDENGFCALPTELIISALCVPCLCENVGGPRRHTRGPVSQSSVCFVVFCSSAGGCGGLASDSNSNRAQPLGGVRVQSVGKQCGGHGGAQQTLKESKDERNS